jgi:flagellar protein FlhE
MRNFKKLNGIVVLASVGFAMSPLASAGAYDSSVRLPTLHSKGYVYTASVPVPSGPIDGGKIKSVDWTWDVHGWPTGLQVYLCQAPTKCIDISRVRAGSTQTFKDIYSTQPFYFEMKISGAAAMPVAGLLGRLKVHW